MFPGHPFLYLKSLCLAVFRLPSSSVLLYNINMLLGFKTELKVNNKQRTELLKRGFSLDRDLNAAINLKNAVSHTVSACGSGEADFSEMKQEDFSLLSNVSKL